MSWRAPLRLILSLALALVSQTMAVTRAQAMQPGQTLVICSGYGVATITLDADGNPTAPVHPCPDCLAGLGMILPASASAPAAPQGYARSAPVSETYFVPTVFWPVGPARGPPPAA